ncbi:MAG: ABC transporter substrate-binding protein [Desulfovibrio sp.]|jgi:iron complex transport system substrate-binding protein|nr:ABC transporter substrate-binding protein [Desulfovibrio sp.]
MKNTATGLAFLCLLLSPLMLVASDAAQITDDTGRSVTLNTPVTRVIALYGAFNELLTALDAADCLVARTASDAEFPAIAHLPAIGTHMRPNAELIVAQKPDVVLQLAGRQEALVQAESLRALGIDVLTFTMESFEDIFRVTSVMGELVGRQEQATVLVASFRGRLAALYARCSEQKQPRARVFYEVRYPNLLAAGTCGIVNEIITAACGENVVREPKKLVRCNEETLILSDPDIYIVQQGPMNPAPPLPADRPHYRALRAVRASRVLTADEKRFARPGPRAIDAAEELSDELLAYLIRQSSQ